MINLRQNYPNKMKTVSPLSTGVVSLEQFSQLEEEEKNIAALKNYGLTAEEIQMYKDYERGMDYLENTHKNMEITALETSVKCILDKIKIAQNRMNSETHSTVEESPFQNKDYSIDPNILINDDQPISSTVHRGHPINYLDELKDDIFGHMDIDNLPSANKRRKILRRMERKLAKEILLPEPCSSNIPGTSTIASISEPHSYNEFVRVNPSHSKTVNCNATIDRHPNSKWDIKDMSKYEKIIEARKSDLKSKDRAKPQTIGCKPEALYTIKDKKIVRLEKKTIIDGQSKKIDHYQAVEIKLPINKAEEQLLEGSRLSLEDIKKIPKFEKYEAGECSKKLYIKNLSNNIKEEDLNSLFHCYDKSTKVTLMVGKMRGQAFVTFQSPEMASKSLSDRNGTILKGKPIIIMFGKG